VKEQILSEITRLEHQHEIKILYAVESGSRAWGFESTDSDWDVRFIYIHRPEWYLSIEKKKDNIAQFLPNELDFAGWEIRKMMNLLRKSNPPLLEWLKSPVVYFEDHVFIKKLRACAALYFNPKACMYHYLSMAQNNYSIYLKTDKVKIKKYFYTLRPILACKWIESFKQPPPDVFDDLLKMEESNKELVKEVLLMQKKKKAGIELTLEPRNELLNNYIEFEIGRLRDLLQGFDVNSHKDPAVFNQLFRETLMRVWDWNNPSNPTA
jgi:predicted nucleotidyltransferase